MKRSKYQVINCAYHKNLGGIKRANPNDKNFVYVPYNADAYIAEDKNMIFVINSDGVVQIHIYTDRNNIRETNLHVYGRESMQGHINYEFSKTDWLIQGTWIKAITDYLEDLDKQLEVLEEKRIADEKKARDKEKQRKLAVMGMLNVMFED